MASEFDLIRTHFRPLASEPALALADDAAVFAPPPGRELVITTDTMVEGVHYLPGTAPNLIARKLLRVNLSDIAAMGARPLGYLLALSVRTDTPEAWIAGFAQGLAQDQAAFGIALFGGDTTGTPGPASLTVTMLGHVAPGAAWRRNGARPGDQLWVTGPIGRGVLGLRALRGEIADPDGALAAHYRLPTPRLDLGLNGMVTAAMDLSDGLVQDAGHIARASGLRLVIDLPRVPVPAAAMALLPGFVTQDGAGGDDYELLLSAAPAHEAALAARGLTRIGHCEAGEAGVTVRDAAGHALPAQGGWQHF